MKYAIERGLLPGVPNGYLTLYFADLVGLSQAQAAVKKDPKKAPNISGIATPNSSTIVFNLSKPSSIGVIDALSLPLSSPVPQGVRGEVRLADAVLDVRPAPDRRRAVLHLELPARQADHAAAQPELHRGF